MEQYIYMSLLNGDEELLCDGYCTTSYTVDWRWRARGKPDFNELGNSNPTSETVWDEIHGLLHRVKLHTFTDQSSDSP